MALSNAEKQRRWRERHIKRRRDALRVANLLIPRNWPDGHIEEIARGLRGFFSTAGIVALRKALKPVSNKDMEAHNAAQWQEWRALWLKEHPGPPRP